MKNLITTIILFLVFLVVGCTGGKIVKKDNDKKIKNTTLKVKKVNSKDKIEQKVKSSSNSSTDDIKNEFKLTMSKYKLDKDNNNISFSSYIKALDKISDNYEKFPEIGFDKGVLYLKLSKFNKAYDALLKTYNRSKYIPALINLMYLAYKTNRINKVLPIVKNALKNIKKIDKKTKEDLLANYSFLLIINKKYDDAINVIREILSFKPRSILAYKNLGILYTKNKKFSLAEKIIDLSISYTKNKKEQASLYVIKARFYKAKFESVKMIASYKKAISLDKKNIDANYALALTYLKYGDGKKSVKYFKTLVANYPDNILFKNLYAISLRMSNNYKKSLETYSDLIKLEPSYIDAYYNRGLLLQKYLEKPSKAISDYNKYKSLGGKLNVSNRIKTCKQMIKDIEQIKAEEAKENNN